MIKEAFSGDPGGWGCYLAGRRNQPSVSVTQTEKRKHVQLVLNGGMDSSELEDLFQNPADADTKIKRCIKLYSMEKANERR